MKQENFLRLWDNAFDKYVIEIENMSNVINYRDNKLDIWSKYEAKNKEIHQEMRNKENLLDRHKIASIVAYSILISEPFNIVGRKEKKKTYMDFLPNEMFALKCALETIKLFALFETKDTKNKVVYDKIRKQGFIFPSCHEKTEETYLDHILRALYHSKNKHRFDIFTYALLFFTIEEFSLLSLKNDK